GVGPSGRKQAAAGPLPRATSRSARQSLARSASDGRTLVPSLALRASHSPHGGAMYPLFDLLRCPLHPDAALLAHGGPTLHCTRCARTYPVVDGIPDLVVPDGGGDFLASESRQWDEHAPRYDEKRQHDLIYQATIDAAVQALNAAPGDFVL